MSTRTPGRTLRAIPGLLIAGLLIAACASAPAVEPTTVPAAVSTSAPVADATAEPAAATASGCPAATVASPAGLNWAFPYQVELSDFEQQAGCTLSFNENPQISTLNARIGGNPSSLPAVAERLPNEPLVIAPYDEIGVYGGTLDGLSNATEAGTSDMLSLRHVSLVRYADDLQTIVPFVAKNWQWNSDYTELTMELRAGHKWSDGQPFSADDIVFWYNDLILNENIYPETPSRWLFNGEPMGVEAVSPTTVKFSFSVPTPGILNRFAVDYGQTFQPRHFLSQFHIDHNPDADTQAREKGFENWAEWLNNYYGASDWKDVPSPLIDGSDSTVVPTLEAFIVVEETAEGRKLVANPYFFVVDTAGNQLPYINELNEQYVPDKELRLLRVTNGQVDYKTQSILLEDYPLLKENEATGNYVAELAPGLGVNVFYAFNTTHKDPTMRAIFNDLRFRQAMSIALDRDEINEIVYLGQGTPQQSVPADPNTVNFVTDEQLNAFIGFDAGQAGSLLDAMGMVDTDGDTFREKPDGTPFGIQIQFSNQAAPVRLHELVKGYWEAVGIKVETKEVTSDEYRAQANNNDLDVTVWVNDGTSAPLISQDVTMMVPPFGDFFNPGTGFEWANWIASDGAEGSEPPEDVKKLYELTSEFIRYPLGTAESDRLGAEIVDIHVNNLWKIGIVGNVVDPYVHHNNLGNFKPFTAKTYDYYWAYPYRPFQWYLKDGR
ncbi:MAG: ABC transporter substrate-binding protein [Oscillochloris sp.]|nr:ABC transporter substrate-binding protein [Oscillochloris sp.]